MKTYEEIIARAEVDSAFREGLLVAAEVCRAQEPENPATPPCPSGMAAVYIERLANGQLP